MSIHRTRFPYKTKRRLTTDETVNVTQFFVHLSHVKILEVHSILCHKHHLPLVGGPSIGRRTMFIDGDRNIEPKLREIDDVYIHIQGFGNRCRNIESNVFEKTVEAIIPVFDPIKPPVNSLLDYCSSLFFGIVDINLSSQTFRDFLLESCSQSLESYGQLYTTVLLQVLVGPGYCQCRPWCWKMWNSPLYEEPGSWLLKPLAVRLECQWRKTQTDFPLTYWGSLTFVVCGDENTYSKKASPNCSFEPCNLCTASADSLPKIDHHRPQILDVLQSLRHFIQCRKVIWS